MREIHPGIFVITEGHNLFGFRPRVNIYVVTGGNGLVFDAGYGDRRSVRHFLREFDAIRSFCERERRPFHVERILPSHSHPDHFSGLKKIRQRTGMKILLTPGMAETLATRKSYKRHYEYGTSRGRRSLCLKIFTALFDFVYEAVYGAIYGTDFIPDPDVIIGEDSEITVNGEAWRLFSSPGHAEDHVSLYDPVRGILFSGDNVLRSITPWLGPPRSDIREYTDSLERILALPGLSLVLAAHGGPIPDPKDRIEKMIRWRRKRTEEVLSAIALAGPKGADSREILRRLYGRQGRIKLWLAEGWILVTLDYLEKQGLIRRVARNRYAVIPGKMDVHPG